MNQLRVYLVTDRRQTRGRPLAALIGQALRGGIGAVQLREHDLETGALLELARELRALTARHQALLLINDRIDVALACQADGVHLPADSFAIEDARTLLGPERLIGVSTHHPREVAAAAARGADFAVFGPVFDTPSKKSYGPPVGLSRLEEAARTSSFPVLGIGGITRERTAAVMRAGAAGVAVIRAVLEADDPTLAAQSLLDAVRGA
jgi:thiamine-phosphate pyrophosphorylase